MQHQKKGITMKQSNVERDYAFYTAIDTPKELELNKGMQETFTLRDDFSLFVQVCEDGDAIYVSVNKEMDGETVNLARVNRFLSIEEGSFVVSDFCEVTEEVEIHPTELEKLSGIVYYVKNSLMTKAIKQLLTLSGLTLRNPNKKYVWLNVLEGFSDTFKEGDFGFNSLDEFLMEMSLDDPRKEKNTWKLIEYTCHNDHDFELNKHMRLR